MTIDLWLFRIHLFARGGYLRVPAKGHGLHWVMDRPLMWSEQYGGRRVWRLGRFSIAHLRPYG